MMCLISILFLQALTLLLTESLFCRVFILQAVETPFSSAWAAEYRNLSASPQVPHSCGLGSRKQISQVCSVGTWNLQDLFSVKHVIRKIPSESPNWGAESEGDTTVLVKGLSKQSRPEVRIS